MSLSKLRPKRARACPMASRPATRSSLTRRGSLSSRSVLATASRLLPIRLAICSWVSPNSSASRAKPSASSIGFRSCRFRFSMSAISSDSVSVTSLIIAGIFLSPAFLEARHRRSPTTSSYPFSPIWTITGWSTPCSRIDCSSSSNFLSSKYFLGC